MQKKGVYSDCAIEKHMRNVKRIGHLLLNAELFTPQEIASAMGGNSVHKERELRWTVEDYRYFKNASEKRQEQFEILMTLQDKVLV